MELARRCEVELTARIEGIRDLQRLLAEDDSRAAGLAADCAGLLQEKLGGRYGHFMRQIDYFDYEAAFATLSAALGLIADA